MNTRFKYGFAWSSLLSIFIACTLLGLGLLWLGLSNQTGMVIIGIELSPTGFKIITLFVGGIFTISAWKALTIMFYQAGMQPHAWINNKVLNLPVKKIGQISIPLDKITQLKINEQSGQRILWIKTDLGEYKLESQLMAKTSEFEALVALIKANAPTTAIEEKKY